MKAFLILEDGTVFEGMSAGAQGTTIGEIVFNTSMTGYQRIITDPSNFRQIVLMTYPLIGNYGVNDEDNESDIAQVGGLIAREICKRPSNHRMTQTLGDYLTKSGVVAIEGIDTRELTKTIREKGGIKGAITTSCDFDIEKYKKDISRGETAEPVRKVTCKAQYKVSGEKTKYNVALIDLGTKKSFVKMLSALGCSVTVMPAYTSAEAVVKGGFDGIVLYGGPGDPKGCGEIIENIKTLQSSGIPIFGVGLGHLLIALSNGFDTAKMTSPHNGANYPVVRKENATAHITLQNHNYAVVNNSVDGKKARITHYNLNDNTVEGIKYKNIPVFSVQFYPGALLQPFDSGYLFKEFFRYMEGCKNA